MTEPLFARKIRAALDTGLKLPPEVSARLVVARERALERHRGRAGEFALAGTGRAAARLGSPGQWLARALLPAVFLVAAVIGIQQWQEHQRAAHIAAQQAAEHEETDTGLLTGDLPINAYVDEDFHAWLKRSSE